MKTDDYLYYANRAFDGMCQIAVGLGDDLANRRPNVPGANTAYGLIVHCIGVANYWAGALVAGRAVERDRDAEFVATGPTAKLVSLVEAAKAQLAADVAEADFEAPLRREPAPQFKGPPREPSSQGAVLLHVLEELYQHYGQLELIRDVLRVESAAAARAAGTAADQAPPLT